jgi:anti-sigma factor RsiW
MSCEEMELAAALRLDGGLPEAEARQLSAHLENCAACAEFERDLLAARAALRDLALDEVDAAVYRGLRAGVLEKASRRARSWSPLWLLGPAAAGAVLAIALVPAGTIRRPVPPPAPVAPPVAVTRFARESPPTARLVKRIRPVRPPAREPLLLQLVSGDPDVVIYWQVD